MTYHLQTKILSLFHRQLRDWAQAAEHYEALKSVKNKTFPFDGFQIRVQFNPARAVSTQAKLDWRSIESRPCFLCAANRPPVQEEVDFKGRYDILVNPYPILPCHFTIASKRHEPQQIEGKMDDMLDLAEALPDFVILFNGAKAGASAPDHFHFQAGNADFFHQAIEQPTDGLITKEHFFSTQKEEIKNQFNELCTRHTPDLMNIFLQRKNNGFSLTVFPRKCHRPRQFFVEDDSRLLISPGAIDMTGTLIVTREEDFEKINKDVIIDVFKQIS